MSSRKADLAGFGLLGVAIFALTFRIRWFYVVPWVIAAGLLVFGLARRRWVPLLAFGGAQLSCLGVLLVVLVGKPTVDDYTSGIPFDSAGWKTENRQDARGIRVRMVDDLLRKHNLVGMSRTKMENLLGVPPATDYFRNYDYVYWLGRERGLFNIDSEWLAVKFTGDTVARADVVRD